MNTQEDQICECGGRFNRYIEPRILLLLAEKESYGYEIVERLNAEPGGLGGELDTATIYRKLREMEREGLVESEWAMGKSGPPRRIYKITAEGGDRLFGWVKLIRQRIEALKSLVERCEKFCPK